MVEFKITGEELWNRMERAVEKVNERRVASPGSGLVSDVRFGFVAESSTTGRDGHALSAANTVPRCDLQRHHTR
jgi:hypothetical protein